MNSNLVHYFIMRLHLQPPTNDDPQRRNRVEKKNVIRSFHTTV